MDPSSYGHGHHHQPKQQHHHSNHPRYVPAPLHPLPPPPYQQSPTNLYPSRLHLPPPQLPPPPRPLPLQNQHQQQHQRPYHLVPAPQPPLSRQQHPSHHTYIPHHPQYNLSPNLSSNPTPSNVSHQFNDFPQRRVLEFALRPDYWPENRVSRPHPVSPRPVSNLDREVHYHQFDRRPASPGIDVYRDLEGNSRFRGLELNQRERDQREREELVRVHTDRWISSRSSRDFGIVSMGFESNLNNSGFDHEVTENVRWGSRLHDELIDNGNNDIDERDEIRVFSRKIDYLHDSETEMFSDRGTSGEVSHEFSRTPRKQIQKKSALLRINKAKPNHRSREDDRSHYLGYYNEGRTGSFRGKDLVIHSDHGMEEKEREGSPVELDVSFKSNSLVAKAIVTPPSSATVSDSSGTPRNSKIRKVMVFDKDGKILKPNKANESSAKLDASTSVANVGSVSEDSKQSKGKVKASGTDNVHGGLRTTPLKGSNVSLKKGKPERSPKVTAKVDESSLVPEDARTSDKKSEPFEGKGTSSCIGNMRDGGAQICSNKVNVSSVENKVGGTPKSTHSDKTGASVGKPSSLKATKKKIVLKKVVKKVSNSPLNLAKLKSTKKCDKSVKADTSIRCQSSASVPDKGLTPLKMKIDFAAEGSARDVNLQCCLKESAPIFEKDVNGASKDIVSEEVGTDVDPGDSVAPRINRKRSGSPPLQMKIESAAEGSAGDVDLRLSLKESALISENEDVNGASKDTVSKEVGTDVDPGNSVALRINRKRSGSTPPLGSSGPEETKVDEGSNNVDNSPLGQHVIPNVEDRTETPNETIKSDNLGVEDVNKQLYHNEIKSNYGLLRSEDIKVNDDVVDAGSSSVAMLSSTGFYSGSSNTVEMDDCDIDNVNFGSKQVCAAPVSSAVENGTAGELAESNCSVGRKKMPHFPCSEETQVNSGPIYVHCSDHDRSAIHNPHTVYVNSGESKDEYAANIHKRKVGTNELDLSRSTFTNISVESTDVHTSANCQETTIGTSGLNSYPAEVMGSGFGWLDFGLHNSMDKVWPLHESSSNDTLAMVSDSPDGRSPENKRRKISTSSSLAASVISEGDISKSVVHLPSSFTDDVLQLEQKAKVLSRDSLHREGIDPCSAFVESVDPSSLHPLKLGGEHLSTTTPVSAANNHQVDDMDIEGDGRGTAHVDTVEEQKIISSEVTQCRIAPEHKSSSLNQRLPSTDVEDNNNLPLKDDLPSTLKSLVFGVDANEVSAMHSNDEAIPAPVILSDLGSPYNHDNLVTGTSNCNVPVCQKLEEQAFGDDKFSDDKPMIEGACNSSASMTCSQHSNNILKLNDAFQYNHSVAGKAGLLPSQGSINPNSPNSISGETQGRKNQPSQVVPSSYPARSSYVFSASKNITSSTSITKPRTWHRTNNSSASPLSGNKPALSASSVQGQTPKKAAYFQGTSYIRKGNSLVRKPVSVPALLQGSHALSSSVYRLNSGVVNEVKKGAGPNSRADSVDLRTGGGNAYFQRPTTPPLSSVPKVSNRTSNSSVGCTSSPLAEPSIIDCCETKTNHASSMEITDELKSPEDGLKSSGTLNGNGSANNLEDWTEQNESTLVLSNAKRVTYVKPKSNQLVATSDCGRAFVANADKNQPISASFDGYYKKSKNQLIRTALESQINQVVTVSDGNSEGQVADKLISRRTFGKRRSNKVVTKTHKPSKLSLVWTLHSARLLNNDDNSLRCPGVLPQLFPWKRMTYWRSFKLNSVSSCNSSLSAIGRKMLLLRKRNTVYTRSINGYSIRKSKVLSVGGSSLKWSKSIERHSRKANEEATLAVAEAERKRRERKSTVSGTGKRSYSSHKVVHGTKLHPGERIFRIGSVRYKMDSSRRSLQRISDEDSSCSAGHLSENSAKKSYVPRRLVIGNDEYVRIGNGNQLVRDPKKRTRVLASEKVRWSLHTARLRLVKKKKYCQFFTRFGKCNKDDGKCPYIHDSSKIAVCTKFLKGLCSNPNCKLTHKVIPDRMPDCSYYLQGLCTNKSCPYRHVHVNPNASTCEGFLRGYCADGNECRKKHSYVCPNFEATGSCPEGSKCKLHHPKKRSKGKKSNRSMEHKNARWRYFGIDISEPKRMVSERNQAPDDNDTLFDGKFSDYIRLDVSDDETGEIHQVMNDPMTFGDNDSDLQLDDLDELIKPIRIMNK